MLNFAAGIIFSLMSVASGTSPTTTSSSDDQVLTESIFYLCVAICANKCGGFEGPKFDACLDGCLGACYPKY